MLRCLYDALPEYQLKAALIIQQARRDVTMFYHRLRRIASLVWLLLQSRRVVFACGVAMMIVNRIASLALPATTAYVIDSLVQRHTVTHAYRLLLALSCVSLLQVWTFMAVTRLLAREGQRIAAELRVKLHAHLLLLPLHFFDSQHSGAILTRLTSDVDGVQTLLGVTIIELFGSLVLAALAFILLLRINVTLTLTSVAAVIIFILWFIHKVRLLHKAFPDRDSAQAGLVTLLCSALSGIRVIKSFTSESMEQNLFLTAVVRSLDASERVTKVESDLYGGAQATIGGLGVLVLAVGIRLIMTKQLTLGGYVSFTMLLGYTIFPLMSAATAGTHLTGAVNGVENALAFLAEDTEVRPDARAHFIPRRQGSIVFKAVTFGYEPHNPVINKLSFDIKAGSNVAFVGPSGSGKTTIANLICAFHVPSGGAIFVDGFDLSLLSLSSYRAQLGLISQETFLFHDTIRANVLYANPDATEEQLSLACKMAYVDEFALRLPLKYNTMVGERGMLLSGGQKQRISIARAMLRAPRILILDEATSHLDLASEKTVQTALDAMAIERTTIIIAHRLSTVRKAHEIFYIDKGSIVEHGTHEQLYDLGGYYRALWDSQC